MLFLIRIRELKSDGFEKDELFMDDCERLLLRLVGLV